MLEAERVLLASSTARAAGVRPGLRRGGVLMLLPEARLLEREPTREAAALQEVAIALLQYTPLVAQAEEATLLLDIGASLRLFGGVRALCGAIRARVHAMGYSASLSCSPTARGAWLLARAGAGRALAMVTLGRRLDRLACAWLAPARPYAEWLDGIGCSSIGQLRRLPRPGLQRRCGAALLEQMDAAYGLAPEMHDWVVAPPSFHAKLELFDRIEHADALLGAAQRLLLQLVGWLCARQLAVLRVVLQLEHERGRVARPPTPVVLALAEPAWSDEHLLRLLRERLAKLELEAPVIGLCLEAPQVEAMVVPSACLFPEPGGSARDQARLLELLAARLGPDNVLQAAPAADYRPECANRWAPASAPLPARLPPQVQDLPRPGWLLAKPVALLLRNERPFYGSPLTLASSAERIEAGWWGQSQARDYFIARGQDHAFYWVYRERAADAEGAPRWFLHGLFA